jgi:hypothetical protein
MLVLKAEAVEHTGMQENFGAQKAEINRDNQPPQASAPPSQPPIRNQAHKLPDAGMAFPWPAALDAALFAGRRVDAIRIYRTVTKAHPFEAANKKIKEHEGRGSFTALKNKPPLWA